MKKILIKRKLARAFGPWNYNLHDDTYRFWENGQWQKVSAIQAEEIGVIIRPGVSDIPIIKPKEFSNDRT